MIGRTPLAARNFWVTIPDDKMKPVVEYLRRARSEDLRPEHIDYDELIKWLLLARLDPGL